MKKILLFLILLLVMLGGVKAQILEEERSMSQGVNNSLSIEIPDASEKMVEKLWKSFTKKYGKTKRNRKTDEYFTDNAEIVAIGGANTVDIYAKISGNDQNASIIVWFDLGGAYLNSSMHPQKYVEGEKLLMRFALKVLAESTKERLEDEEDKLKSLNKDLDKLKKENEKYHQDIEDYKRKIKEAEENIVKNQADQKNTEKAIETQKSVIKSVQEELEALED